MTFDELLNSFPLPWDDPRLRALHEAVAATFYKPADIERVWTSAGLGPQHLSWGQSAATMWFEGFNCAAGQQSLDELIGKAAEGSPALATRIEELSGDDPPLPAESVVAPDAGHFKNFSGDAQQERQIIAGVPTLRDVRFLGLGLERAKSVCRIDANFGAFHHDGTGFRVGKSTVLTNHHVVFDEKGTNAAAISVQLVFRHELGLDGKMRTDTINVNVDPATMRGNMTDDWALLTVLDPMPDVIPILSLGGPIEPLKVDDRVSIIQHPKGLPKKVGLYHNLVRHVDATVVQYWTDTDVGSSGSPVFDENWDVVALHHAAVKKDGEDHGYANQGRSIARIREQLLANGGVL